MEQTQPDSPRISWHAAFIEALQMELQAYHDVLEFLPEYQLTSEPLRIDCVVIKKAKDAVIKKNIAAIFRGWNLLEYKSPGDYVSVPDFYKVYGYACLYASFKKVPITDLTLSFVESHYPKKLLEHLRDERGYTVAESGSGIYNVEGDILPIQVIDSRKLSGEENLWLRNLSDDLGRSAFVEVSREITRQGKAARIGAYLEVIMRANSGVLEEAIKMDKTLEKVLEDTGLAAKWEARGEARGRVEGEARGRVEEAFGIAQNMVNLGLPIETVISATRLEPEKVKTLYQR